MDFNLSTQEPDLEMITLYLYEISSAKILAYKGGSNPIFSPFNTQEDFLRFIARGMNKHVTKRNTP
jgi:hypothetical protein